MSCIAFLQKIGLLHPYLANDAIAAERENMIRDNRTAIEASATSSREARSVAIVASAAIRFMKESN